MALYMVIYIILTSEYIILHCSYKTKQKIVLHIVVSYYTNYSLLLYTHIFCYYTDFYYIIQFSYNTLEFLITRHYNFLLHITMS